MDRFLKAILIGLFLCFDLGLFASPTNDVVAPGDLDASFGIAGIVTTNIGEGTGPACRMSKTVMQPDGKYVMVGGIAKPITNNAFGVARFNNDGTLDRTFGDNGKVITDLSTEDDFFKDVALQPDGKIVAVGFGYNYTGTVHAYLTIIRYNQNGSLDSSFNGDGIVQADFGISAVGSGVEILPDGRIVVTGTYPSNNYVIVARFNSDGSPDITFSGGLGFTVYRIANNQYNTSSGLAVQSDGKILTVGTTKVNYNSSTASFQVSRLNEDGTLDTSFNGTGWVTASFNSNPTNEGEAVVLQPDGKIVAVGMTANQAGDFAIMRLNTNGTLDNSFDSDGKQTTHIETTQTGILSDDRAFDVGFQTDGKLVVGGYARIVNLEYFSVVRYNIDGSLDTSFDGDGIIRFSSPLSAYAFDAGLIVQSDGKIVIGGEGNVATPAFSLARLNSDGTVDSAFGGVEYGGGISPVGVANTYFAESNDQARCIALQPDGKIVVVGTSGQFVSVARYTQNGSLDLEFGVNGKKKIVVPSNNSAAANKVLIQKDGKILIVGTNYTYPTRYDFLLLRLYQDGTLDSGFGINGLVTTDFGSTAATSDYAYGASIQPDGKIVVVGKSDASPNGRTGFAVARYNTNGAPDSTFGNEGKVFHRLTGNGDEARDVEIAPDGKLLVAGTVNIGDFGVARLSQDGSLDLSFNETGFVKTNLNNFGSNFVKDFVIQADGKLLLAGDSNGSIQSIAHAIAMVRYQPDGTLDSGFGNGGVVLRQVPAGTDTIEQFAIQSNGKILVVGRRFLNSHYDSCIYSFNPDGSPDVGFGDAGQVVFDLSPDANDEATTVSVQGDGKVVVGGFVSVDSLNVQDYSLLRLFGDTAATRRNILDFDGDGKTDLSVFRPNGATGSEWWYQKSSNGSSYATQFGTPTDKIVAADYTGDEKADIAIWRPSTGEWFVLRSEDQTFYAFPFGATGDVPAPGDFDGDGKADAAVFRPSNSTWYIQNSGGGTTIQQFGTTGDQPVVGDYDGDGKSDIAIFRPNGASGGAEWWIQRSTAGLIATQFGVSTDKAVAEDYTGDGKTDVAIWRPSTGEWFILRSEDLSFYAFPFGSVGDIPVPGDYDGDGKADAAVFRPSSSTWFAQGSTAGTIIQQFGAAGDLPVPNEFVR